MGRTQDSGVLENPGDMALLLIIGAASYALVSALSEKFGPGRPD